MGLELNSEVVKVVAGETPEAWERGKGVRGHGHVEGWSGGIDDARELVAAQSADRRGSVVFAVVHLR